MGVLPEIFARKAPLKNGGHADLLLGGRARGRGPLPADDDVRDVPRDPDLPKDLIALPDIVQPNDFACGACVTFSVASHFAVGPKSLKAWVKELGTTPEESTDPQAIAEALEKYGCQVEMKERMTLNDLTNYWKRGWPVIVLISEYMNDRNKKAKVNYGHYVAVLGFDHGFVYVQDPSMGNLLEPNEKHNIDGLPDDLIEAATDFLGQQLLA